jgi:hypothetical protein
VRERVPGIGYSGHANFDGPGRRVFVRRSQDYNTNVFSEGVKPLRRKTTDRIDQAVEGGSRNQATLELVQNWCRHARIQRGGGVGMVEATTALPIGLIGMVCEHAPAGGILSWDLADAAIDFHDRNCAQCAHREAVGFPNISALVGERDARRARAEAEQLAHRNDLLARRTLRQSARQQLRTQLPWPSRSIVDDIDELDQDAPKHDLAPRLIETAKLAPETFTAELIEHLFVQLESGEGWFVDCGLRLLLQLNVNLKRLVGCAMKSLRAHCAVDSAAHVVELHAALIDPSEISPALPPLADLANPERMPLSNRRIPEPGPLRAVHVAHRLPLETAIDRLLRDRNPYHVSLAVGAIEVLARTDRSSLRRFTRAMADKLNGAQHLIDERQTGYSGDDECINRLKTVLALALRYAPDETDTVLAGYLAGAGGDSEARLYEVYAHALNGGRRRRSGDSVTNAAAPTALRRLLGGLNSQNPDTLREIQGALRYCADKHTVLARREFNSLLGQAIVLDDVLRTFDAEVPQGRNLWESIERRNRRADRTDLQGLLLEWAARAAKASPVHITEYLQVLTGIPEDRDELRAAFIVQAKHFMDTPEGLNAMLPTLYTAMVGTSVRLRATAAKVLGKLDERRFEDLPDLVHEAFAVLLADSYVWVHRSAVKALQNFKLPDDLNQRGEAALAGWIMHYLANPMDDSDEFLLECLHLYWDRYAQPKNKPLLATMYLKALGRMKPYQAIGELRGLRRDLADVEGFAALTIGFLADASLSEHQAEDVLDTLAAFSLSTIQRHRRRLAEVASAENASAFLALRITEILTGAGAWEEAAQITETFYGRLPETTERRPFRLRANLWRLATKFEEMLSQARLDQVAELASQWRATVAQIDEDRVKHAQQRSIIPSLPMAN